MRTLLSTNYKLKVCNTLDNKSKSNIYIYSDDRQVYHFNSTTDTIIYVDEDIHMTYGRVLDWPSLKANFNYLHNITGHRIEYKKELEVLLEASKYLNRGFYIGFSKEFITFYNDLFEDYIFELDYE